MLKVMNALVALSILFLIIGCGRPGGNATVPQAQPASASDVDIGDHIVHFSAQSTDQLEPDVARTYGIVRSKNRIMLTVSVLKEGTTTVVPAEVTVRTVNLAGQLKNVTMRKIQEQEAVYYIGETAVANRETLVFNISITPKGATEASDVRFTRKFYTN
ncbi:MAG: DUF4426 domain-containing protein [Gammaproteobacteria bacterium]|nr:MAG: DUF4426 domain-containing protein [Gammaproteobacteria bacterium]